MVNWKSIEFLEEYNEKLLTENLLLHLKIDKAIEYIKSWVLDEYSITVLDEEEDICNYEPNAKEELLKILEDKENE